MVVGERGAWMMGEIRRTMEGGVDYKRARGMHPKAGAVLSATRLPTPTIATSPGALGGPALGLGGGPSWRVISVAWFLGVWTLVWAAARMGPAREPSFFLFLFFSLPGPGSLSYKLPEHLGSGWGVFVLFLVY